MKKEFRYYLNDIEILEPVNWKDITFDVRRDSVYWGLERRAILDKIILWGKSMKMVQKIFAKDGLMSEVVFRVDRLNYKALKYVKYSEGALFFDDMITNYSIEMGETLEINVVDSSISEKLENREKLNLPIGNDKTIQGEDTSLESRGSIEALYRSRGIRLEGDFKIADAYIDQSYNNANNLDITIPTQSIFNNSSFIKDQAFGFFPIGSVSGMTLEQCFALESADVHDITMVYDFNIDYDNIDPINPTINGLKLKLQILTFDGVNFTLQSTTVINQQDALPGAGNSANFSGTLLFPKNNIYLYRLCLERPQVVFDSTWRTSSFEFTYDTFIDESRHKTVFIYEAVQSLLEQMTDTPNVLYSEALGKASNGYAQDGEFSMIGVTNGYLLRNAANSDGSEVELTASYVNLYKTITGILGLAMWYDDSTEKIHIEKREDAFSGSEVELNLQEVKSKIADKFLYTDIKIGNTPIKYENVNGTNEFNNTLEFVAPFPVKETKLDLRTKYNTDYLGIELARKVQFNQEGNVDTKYDDKVFLVELEFNGVEYQNRQGATYNDVQDIPLPDLASNLLFSPKRSLIRNSDLINAIFWKHQNENLQFKSASNLAALTSQELISDPVLVERDNLLASDMKKLFKPIFWEGEVPGRELFKLFKDQNTIYTFTYKCKSSLKPITVKGYLWSAKIKRNVASVVLLEQFIV